MHYYLQYDGNAPYQKIREMRSRFMTEIGFQSYPDWKTVCSFTEPEDRLPYTPIMYAHQKCASGNEAIELYMERDYAVPKNFEDYVFLSQVQAGEIMRYTVEHFRRDGAYCRGMILWQLNDCWPVGLLVRYRLLRTLEGNAVLCQAFLCTGAGNGRGYGQCSFAVA